VVGTHTHVPHVIAPIDVTTQFVVQSGWSFCGYLFVAFLILMQFSRIDFSAALAEVRLSPSQRLLFHSL
jgi:hypothetical protein